MVGITESAVVGSVADILGTGSTRLKLESVIALGADADTLAVHAVGDCAEGIGDDFRKTATG